MPRDVCGAPMFVRVAAASKSQVAGQATGPIDNDIFILVGTDFANADPTTTIGACFSNLVGSVVTCVSSVVTMSAP